MSGNLLMLAVLAAGMGSEDFHQRERVTQLLERSDLLPGFHLLEGHEDAEVRARVRRVLRRHLERWMNDALEGKAAPWLWLGSYEMSGTVYRHVTEAQRLGLIGPDWPDWREGTRLWLVERYRAGSSAETVRDRVRAMRAAEEKWKADR